VHVDLLPDVMAGAIGGAGDDAPFGGGEEPELFVSEVFDALDGAGDGRPSPALRRTCSGQMPTVSAAGRWPAPDRLRAPMRTPPSARPSKKFIGGEPMNLATKRLAER